MMKQSLAELALGPLGFCLIFSTHVLIKEEIEIMVCEMPLTDALLFLDWAAAGSLLTLCGVNCGSRH